jgi:hypothetical protein
MKKLKLLIAAIIVFTMLFSCKKLDACIAAPQTVEIGQTATLTSCSINADQYEWIMGDGMKYYDKDVTHTYQNTGDYYVELKATKGNKQSAETQLVKVVDQNYKFSGTYTVQSNCEGGTSSYVVTIETLGTSQIRINNFMNMGWQITGNVSGSDVSLLVKNGLQDPAGDLYDFDGGYGTINGNVLTLDWTIDDINYNNFVGVYNCGATLTK